MAVKTILKSIKGPDKEEDNYQISKLTLKKIAFHLLRHGFRVDLGEGDKFATTQMLFEKIVFFCNCYNNNIIKI